MHIEETSFKCFINVHGLKHSICFIYAVLSRIQICRDYALFGGHFLLKFDGRGHQNILMDRGARRFYVSHLKT